MGLDFRKAADLFISSEEELASALRMEPEELKRHRRDPDRVPDAVLRSLADILTERGRAMVRVGELLREGITGSEGNGRAGG